MRRPSQVLLATASLVERLIQHWTTAASGSEFISQLIGLFTENAATVAAGKTALRIISGGFIVSAVSVTASGALEGLGKGTPSLVISLCRYLVIIVPLAFLLSRVLGAAGVWHAFWITELFTAGIALAVYRKAVQIKD